LEAEILEGFSGDEAEGFCVASRAECDENGLVEFFLVAGEGLDEVLEGAVEHFHDGHPCKDAVNEAQERSPDEIGGEKTDEADEDEGCSKAEDQAETGKRLKFEKVPEDAVEYPEDIEEYEDGQARGYANEQAAEEVVQDSLDHL